MLILNIKNIKPLQMFSRGLTIENALLFYKDMDQLKKIEVKAGESYQIIPTDT